MGMLRKLNLFLIPIAGIFGMLPSAFSLPLDTPSKDEYAAVDKRFEECCAANNVTSRLLPWCNFAYLDAEKPRERIPFSDTNKEAADYNSCLFIKGPPGSEADDVRECCAARGIPAESPCQPALCTRDYYVTLMKGDAGQRTNEIGREDAECERYGPSSASQESGEGTDESSPAPLAAGYYPALSEGTRKMRLIAFNCWRDLHVAVLRSGPVAQPGQVAGDDAEKAEEPAVPKGEFDSGNDAEIAVMGSDRLSQATTADKQLVGSDDAEAPEKGTVPADDQRSAVKFEREPTAALSVEGQDDLQEAGEVVVEEWHETKKVFKKHHMVEEGVKMEVNQGSVEEGDQAVVV